MSAWTAPKGPLPARVYWFRRVLVLATVFALTFGVARLFAGDAEERQADVQATTAGAEVTPGPEVAASGGAAPEPVPEPTPEATPEPPPLPTPSGPCTNGDVVVTPAVGAPRTDGKVDMALVLRTRETEACTWQVSADTVTVKISSGSDDYWFSSHCPAAVPTQDVVLYRETDTTVPFVWSGKRSDPECSRYTAWAMPGYYHVMAAAFEGEPTEVQFERTAASITETRAAEPRQQGEGGGKNKKDKKKKERRSPSQPQPSGAVEPTLRD
ncbi:hypothetical protein [Nocardioides solisilvae]|uniref:hypothetical protein n=1 Tax=Nocardioides solisilvae TaxID=1542435 RepID=UPI0013A52FD8|nr:hypothetical protein [Nocardioides solisilvae]